MVAARACVATAWCLANLWPVFLFDASSFQMSNGNTNFGLGMAVCFMLPAFQIGFTTFAFLRFLFFKLKLDNPLAVGKEFIPRSLLLEEQERAMAEQEEIELEARRQRREKNRYIEGAID